MPSSKVAAASRGIGDQEQLEAGREILWYNRDAKERRRETLTFIENYAPKLWRGNASTKILFSDIELNY